MEGVNGPRIGRLTTYPIKGCAGTSVSEGLLTPTGMEHDRTFMVVEPDGEMRSQRTDPRLATIRPRVEAGRLVLRAPGVDDLAVVVDLDGPRRDVRIFRQPYHGIDQGDAAAGWLSEVLEAPCRLVRVPPEHHRPAEGVTPGTIAYADSTCLHLVSRASVDLLAERIAEHGGEPVPMTRFRPNVVVDGWDEPHTEDLLRRVGLGTAVLGYGQLTIRCTVTHVDQSTGTRTGPEPLRTLARYRRAREGGVAFGVSLSVLRPGALAVGDEVVVHEWGGSAIRPDRSVERTGI